MSDDTCNVSTILHLTAITATWCAEQDSFGQGVKDQSQPTYFKKENPAFKIIRIGVEGAPRHTKLRIQKDVFSFLTCKFTFKLVVIGS